MTANDHLKLIDRLKRFAYKLGLKGDDASDLAMEAYADSVGQACVEWHYASVALRNKFLTKLRNDRRRNANYKFTYLDGESEPEEIKRLSISGGQIEAVELSEVVQLIARLDEKTQTVINLAAFEYTADEISNETGLEKKEVYWRLQLARKRLRQKTGRETQKASASKFIGVRRESRKWVAAIRSNGGYYYLGSFGSSEEAAAAYDAAAIRLHGADAKINFPGVERSGAES